MKRNLFSVSAIYRSIRNHLRSLLVYRCCLRGSCLSRFLCLSALLTLLLIVGVNRLHAGSNSQLFRIGTGGQTGVYYPIGKLIGQGITEVMHADNKDTPSNQPAALVGVAQNSAGSIENVRAVTAGELEAGLVQADIAAFAYQMQQMFHQNDNSRHIRAIASLYPEKFQIVVRRDAAIDQITDIRGKRISIDEIGSGTLAVMQIVLRAHGLSEQDFSPVYLKPVFTRDKIVTGELQGFVMMAGAPMEAVTQLHDIGISLVPIAPKIASQISQHYPYLVPGAIPANVYQGIPRTPTVQVNALLVVHAKLSTELVYRVTAALWHEHTLTLLKEGHPQGKSITLETALEGIPIPLHDGAEQWYREHGHTKSPNDSK